VSTPISSLQIYSKTLDWNTTKWSRRRRAEGIRQNNQYQEVEQHEERGVEEMREEGGSTNARKGRKSETGKKKTKERAVELLKVLTDGRSHSCD
jgi:hypothetical protein